MDGDTQITTRISDGKQEVAMETVVDGEVRTERIITYSSDWGDTSKIQTITETVDKGESVKSIFTTEKDEKTGMETRYETYEREIGGDYHELTKFFNDGDRRIETWSSDVKSENGPRTFDETTVHDKESIVTREVKVDGDGKEYIATEVKFLNREDGNGFDNKTEKSITVDKYSEDGSKISSTKYYETGRYDRDGQHGEKGISTSWSNDNKDYIVSASQDKYTQDTKETVTIRSHDGDTVVEKSYAVDGDKMELTFSREYLKCEDGQYLTVSTERYDIGESPERIDVLSDVRDTLDTMSEKIEELSVEKTFMEEIVDTEIIGGTPPDDGYPPDDGIDGGAVDADSSQCEQEPNPDRDPIDVENPADNEDSADETPDTDNSEQTSFDDDLDSDFNDN